MFNNKKKRVVLFIITVFLFAIFVKTSEVKAKDYTLKSKVAKFSDISVSDINNKGTMDIGNNNVTILEDNKYYYRVFSDGTIKDIINKESTNHKLDGKLSKEELVKVADKLIKLLENDNYQLSSIDDTNLETKNSYYFIFKQKNHSNINNGNCIGMEIFEDGSLNNLYISLQDTTIIDRPINITKEKAKDVVFNYLKQNSNISVDNLCYDDSIEDRALNSYKIERDVYKNTSVWEISIRLEEYSNFHFKYIVDANSGEIIFKGEPKK